MDELPANPESAHTWAAYFIHFFQKWSESFSTPKGFLGEPRPFHPSEQQMTDALSFYLGIVAICLVVISPMWVGQKNEFAERVKLIGNSVMGLFFTLAVAMSWHFAFHLMGGSASFSGSCLAYVYAAGPLLIPLSFVTLLVYAALPPELRAYASNPLAAKAVMNQAMTHPKTKKGLFGLASVLSLILIGRSLFVQFRCMSFIHGVTGFWRLLATIGLSILFAMPITYVMQELSALFSPGSDLELAPPVNAPELPPPSSAQP
jgi:hypothetical protein